MTAQQRDTLFRAPCLPLSFLVRPERRAQKPTGMESFSESACFHRLRDLSWTLDAPETLALLSVAEKAAIDEFDRIYGSLPWRVIDDHPHISELPDDDLSPLVPAGEKLLAQLDARLPARRGDWLRRFVRRAREHAKA